jgi:hypothetical protein
MMIAHRRAIDRVRSASAEAQREQKSAAVTVASAADEVAEAVEASLDRERVRRCLDSLTDVQRESITLAYYGGYTHREMSGLAASQGPRGNRRARAPNRQRVDDLERGRPDWPAVTGRSAQPAVTAPASAQVRAVTGELPR